MPEVIEGQVYLAVLEVAERLDVDPETVRKWVRAKKLSATKLGLKYFVRDQELEAFCKARGVRKGS